MRLANPSQGNVPGAVAVRREFPSQQQQLFGHEPGVKVAEHLCLLGSVIFITDYPRNVSQDELVQWTKLMSSRGAEVETVYGPRITHLLCEYSRTPLAQQALRDGKRLVTAYWLNDTIVKQQMAPPSQILHFPSPYVDQLERPCHKMLASLSGFEGDDRMRVRFICEAIGLRLTGHFSNYHDVLICRKPEGPKYQKAREWRKPVVTVSWLASIYFGFHQSAIHQIHHPKYQQFNAPGNQQDPLKFDLNMAGNYLAAWRVPIKITPEALEKFNKLPPQLRLKRPTYVLQPATGNDSKCSVVHCSSVIQLFFEYQVEARQERDSKQKKMKKIRLKEVAVMWMLFWRMLLKEGVKTQVSSRHLSTLFIAFKGLIPIHREEQDNG